jgi:hypothetical protein
MQNHLGLAPFNISSDTPTAIIVTAASMVGKKIAANMTQSDLDGLDLLFGIAIERIDNGEAEGPGWYETLCDAAEIIEHESRVRNLSPVCR